MVDATITAVVVFSCIVASSAVPVFFQNGTGCCFPSQFEAELDVLIDATTIGIPYITNTLFSASFDYKGNQIAMKAKGPVNLVIMVDFNNATQYIVVDHGRKCLKSRLPYNTSDEMNCFTKYMDYEGFSYLGEPDAKLVMDTYSSDKLMGPGKRLSVTVTEDGCYPISMVILGKSFFELSSLFEVITYLDTRDGITDFSVFDLPESCKGL